MMKKNRFSIGFSLPEIIVGSFILSVVVLTIVSVLRAYVRIVHKSDTMTTAAILAEDISSKIKDQDFDAVFSYDSKIPSGLTTGKLVGSGFDSKNYLIPLSSSPMKPVLIDFENRVKVAGFDQFRIGVIYLRRDASDMSIINTRSDEFVEWSNRDKSGVLATIVNCDYYDTNVCFSDYNSDGDYWDKDLVRGLETPQTGLKMISVTLLKKGETLGVKHGTILSKGGLSGGSIFAVTSPLTLVVDFPREGKRIFHLTDSTKKSLELPTYRTYDAAFFHKNTSAGVTSAVRIDNTPEAVTVNRTHDKFGAISSAIAITINSDKRLLRVKADTDGGQGGYLEIFDQYGVSAPLPGQYHERVYFTPPGTMFEIWEPTDPGFLVLSGPSYLMKDGAHPLWFVKRSFMGSSASPWVTRNLFVDNGVPRLVYKSITEDVWAYGGLTPVHYIRVSDFFQVDGTPSLAPSGIHTGSNGPTSVIMNASKTSWPGKGGSENMVTSTSGSTATFRLADNFGYPWKLSHSVPYTTTWEWGDNVGYKSSQTFVFTIKDPSLDSTDPEISVPSVLPLGFSPNTLLRSGSTDPRDVKQNSEVNFRGVLFFDPESGINFKRFKIEICEDDPALEDMNFDGPTPLCRTILHHENEFKRPNSPVSVVGSFYNYGEYFEYTDPTKFRPLNVAVNFKDPVVVGILAGMSFPIDSVWRIRVSAENWNGKRTVTANDYWRIKIVP